MIVGQRGLTRYNKVAAAAAFLGPRARAVGAHRFARVPKNARHPHRPGAAPPHPRTPWAAIGQEGAGSLHGHAV